MKASHQGPSPRPASKSKSTPQVPKHGMARALCLRPSVLHPLDPPPATIVSVVVTSTVLINRSCAVEW